MVNMKVWTQSQTTGEIALSHMCGGSLIGPDAVLTGECVRAWLPAPIQGGSRVAANVHSAALFGVIQEESPC